MLFFFSFSAPRRGDYSEGPFCADCPRESIAMLAIDRRPAAADGPCFQAAPRSLVLFDLSAAGGHAHLNVTCQSLFFHFFEKSFHSFISFSRVVKRAAQ